MRHYLKERNLAGENDAMASLLTPSAITTTLENSLIFEKNASR
jgi:hypothetical protein